MSQKKKRQNSIESLFQDAYNADTQPRKPKSQRYLGISVVILALFLMLAILGLLIVMVAVLYQPGLIGLGWQDDLTATSNSIRLTEDALAVTAHYNAEHAINIESTRIVLDSWQRQLNHDSTQAALDGMATKTADAIANAQQGTQAALNYEATQSAFDRIGTQAELDYLSTQAAINRDATAMALGFASGTPAANNAIAPTLTPNSQ